VKKTPPLQKMDCRKQSSLAESPHGAHADGAGEFSDFVRLGNALPPRVVEQRLWCR
jgi:hypothetical protein